MGVRMPSSEYYHRQADVCVRMALSASSYEERVRLIEVANEYRDRASRGEWPRAVWNSLEQLQAWRNSEQYKEDRKIGDKYAKTIRAFAVEGLPQN
jgi:hypothetical protein